MAVPRSSAPIGRSSSTAAAASSRPASSGAGRFAPPKAPAVHMEHYKSSAVKRGPTTRGPADPAQASPSVFSQFKSRPAGSKRSIHYHVCEKCLYGMFVRQHGGLQRHILLDFQLWFLLLEVNHFPQLCARKVRPGACPHAPYLCF